MTTELSYEEKFYKNFCDYMTFGEGILRDAYEKKHTTLSPNGISYASGYACGKIKDNGKKWLVESFVKKTNDHLEYIHKKDTEHFIGILKELAPFLEEDHLNELSRIFTGKDKNGKGYIEEEDKEAFWEFIHSFVRLSIHYVHINRTPIKDGEGFKYTTIFMGDIKVKKAAELFGIKLKY